ncbi:MAG: DnaJ domain-containing protein [Spirochaetales bacterium]|nr:DnaJ domain-containing protein [Spirochaetales bacterium]
MRFKGKLIGAVIGSLGGPLGSLLGGLLGHLFDRADEEAKTLKELRPGDSITSAQLGFLSSLIGLSVAVTEAGGEARAAEVTALKGFFRENFPYGEEDQDTLERIIDESFRKRGELDVEGLSRSYKETSSPGGRLLLLRLMFKIMAAVPPGPRPAQLALVRAIGEQLGVEASVLQTLEAEFQLGGWRSGRGPGRAPCAVEGLSGEQAYAILGIPPEAGDTAVRSRYRRMAAQHHPDRVANLGEELVAMAEEKFKLIGEAYTVIGRERGWGSAEG